MTTALDVDALLEWLRSDLTAADISEMVRRYKRGESTRAVADAVGSNPGTVVRVLRYLGVPIRGKGQQTVLTPEIIAAIDERLAQRLSGRRVASAVGVSPSVIHKLLRKRKDEQRKESV